MALLDFLRRKKTMTADERRAVLLKFGRIADGRIVENEVDDAGNEIVQYTYAIHGVDFESSEILSDEQSSSGKYAPGATVAIRFDPKNHGNSILV